MDKDVKICIECKYFGLEDRTSTICKHTESLITRSIVSGYLEYHSCDYMRITGGLCGVDGKLYEKNRAKKLADFFNKIIRL